MEYPVKEQSYETVSDKIAHLHRHYAWGKPSETTIKKYRAFKATQCPGTLDVERIIRRSGEIYDALVTSQLAPVVVRMPVEDHRPTAKTVVPTSLRVTPKFAYSEDGKLQVDGSGWPYVLTQTVGEDFASLQDRLRELDYYTNGDWANVQTAKTKYGPRTFKALVAFQKDRLPATIKGPLSPNAGAVGPLTLEQLNK